MGPEAMSHLEYQGWLWLFIVAFGAVVTGANVIACQDRRNPRDKYKWAIKKIQKP